MPISVNTNVGALASMAASTSTSKALDTALTRLATGKRINTAGDDAAGIAISARLTSEVKGLGMAIKNALDGQGLIDTTEGAQAEVTNILQRMRELAVKSANDTNSASDRKNIDAEIQQDLIELSGIAADFFRGGRTTDFQVYVFRKCSDHMDRGGGAHYHSAHIHNER